MEISRQQRLGAFATWAATHIRGDEKGEAQIFLDRLFQAFGQPGVLEIGGQTEYRIRKAKEDGGGTAFADYVWKPVVLIEMKKRGQNLGRHFRQAFDYWIRLAPNRPKYVVLCNFDEFWIYDFDSAQIARRWMSSSWSTCLSVGDRWRFCFRRTRSLSLAMNMSQ